PAMLVARMLGGACAVAITCAVFLQVPDGRSLSPRWRPALALPTVAYLLALVPLDPARAAGVLTMAVAMVVAVAALIVRLRRARGAQRRQLRWVVAGAVLLATGGGLFAAGLTPLGLYLGFAAVPGCTGIAILRYRLYDIDVIINRAVVLVVLTAFVAAGYVLLVVGVGAVLGTRLDRHFWPS